MNFGRFLFTECSSTPFRMFTRDFNKNMRKFDYKKLVKVNKKANRRPRLNLILREAVPKLGVPGQAVEVKRGYGRNYLIPNRLAVYATKENIEKFLVTKEETETTTQTVHDPKILTFFESACLQIQVQAGIDQWQISAHTIAVECRKQFGVVIPAHCVVITNPITEYGEYMVDIIINHNVTTQLKCCVVPDEQKEAI